MFTLKSPFPPLRMSSLNAAWGINSTKGSSGGAMFYFSSWTEYIWEYQIRQLDAVLDNVEGGCVRHNSRIRGRGWADISHLRLGNTLIMVPCFTFHHGLNIFESIKSDSWMLFWIMLRGVAWDITLAFEDVDGQTYPICASGILSSF